MQFIFKFNLKEIKKENFQLNEQDINSKIPYFY